jgi:hypothetical protein
MLAAGYVSGVARVVVTPTRGEAVGDPESSRAMKTFAAMRANTLPAVQHAAVASAERINGLEFGMPRTAARTNMFGVANGVARVVVTPTRGEADGDPESSRAMKTFAAMRQHVAGGPTRSCGVSGAHQWVGVWHDAHRRSQLRASRRLHLPACISYISTHHVCAIVCACMLCAYRCMLR